MVYWPPAAGAGNGRPESSETATCLTSIRARLGQRPEPIPPGARPEVLRLERPTRGTTLIGAAARLIENNPCISVKAFALVRSIRAAEVTSIREPCVGVIEVLPNGETQRVP